MDETTIDLRDILKVLKKRSKLIIGTFIIFVVTAAIVSLMIAPTYEATTSLRIKQAKGLANSLLGDITGGSSGATKQQMSTYAEILKSRTVVQQVIEETQQDKDVKPSYEGFVTRITTQPVKDTEILNVKVQAGSPEEAKYIANELVAAFLERMTALVRSEQSKVREFIGERMQAAKKELEKAETELQKYKQNQRIVAPADETRALVDKLSTLDKLDADNRVALEASQARFNSAEQQLGRQKTGFIADNPLIQQRKLKLAELEVELVGLQQTYTDGHPKIIALKAAISETRNRLSAEIANVVNADSVSANPIYQGLLQSKLQAEAEISVAAARQQAIQKVLADSEEQLIKLPGKEQGLIRVMRDANVAQEIYIMLAKRYEEARISEVMEPTDVQIVDVAIAPYKPIKPRKTLNVAIAAVLGLFVGTGLAFALEYMNRTIRTADDVEQYLGLPVLGSIPAVDSEEGRSKKNMFTRLTSMFKEKQQQHRRHQRHT